MRTIKIIILALLLLPSLLYTELWAEENITFNFNKVDIVSLIKTVAKITGKNFIIDPKVSGEVTIVTSETMPASELYGVFLSVLQVHGFTAIEDGASVKIVPNAQAKQEALTVYNNGQGGSLRDLPVTSLYKLHYVPAEQLVTLIRPLAGSDSYLVAHKESNTVIIVDENANIKRLVRIIEQLDQPGSGETVIIPVRYASAAELVTVIGSLETKRDKSAGEHLQLMADNRTNSIVLSCEPPDLLRLKTLIASLDTEVVDEESTQVIFLRYSQAKDMVPLLIGIANGTNQAGKPLPTAKSPVTIQADEGTNALIITAGPGAMKSMQTVIRTLDIRRDQLMIEAVIAEVSTDKAAEFGIQWRTAEKVSANRSASIGGTNFDATGSGINQVSVNPMSVGDGLSLGFFNGTTKILGTEILNLSVLVRALDQAGDTNILSTPSLMTMDNQEAEIVVGQNVPFPTGSYTSTGSSTTAVNPFTTYERRDVGIKLKVKPQINEGNTIRLEIAQEVSSLASFNVNSGPITNTRSIKTTVLIDDGKLLVLGGLISDDLQETQQKVPVIGDVPLLGIPFRYNSSKHVKRNLMVFLRPVIVRDANTNSRITFDKYDYIRSQQQGYGQRRMPQTLMPNEPIPLVPPVTSTGGPETTLAPASLTPAAKGTARPAATPGEEEMSSGLPPFSIPSGGGRE
jgi:general secretion pathway protein D